MSDMADQALAIANLKARYCAAADLAASDQDQARRLFGDIFATDFVGDYGFGPLDGAQAIIDFLCTAIASGSLWMIHMLHSPCIRVDGDHATGDWTVLGYMKRRETGAVDSIMGRYSDRFRHTPRGWRIDAVTFTRLT